MRWHGREPQANAREILFLNDVLPTFIFLQTRIFECPEKTLRHRRRLQKSAGKNEMAYPIHQSKSPNSFNANQYLK